MKDLNANDLEAAAKIIEGSARAMGLQRGGGLNHGQASQAHPRPGPATAPPPMPSTTPSSWSRPTPRPSSTKRIEIAVNLGVDPRHADQQVRGVVNLPSGTGRDVRVAVIAKDAKADEATAAGADIVGAEDLVERIQGGFMDFDRVIATPDMMALVGRLGKVLGPRGLMPNPRSAP